MFNPVTRFLINRKWFSKCDLICFPTLACHYLDDRFIEPKGDKHYSAKN